LVERDGERREPKVEVAASRRRVGPWPLNPDAVPGSHHLKELDGNEESFPKEIRL
jgi:hypothetical protein